MTVAASRKKITTFVNLSISAHHYPSKTMNLELFKIDVKVIETGKNIPLELQFVSKNSGRDLDRVFEEVLDQIQTATEGKRFKIERLSRTTQEIKVSLN